VTRSQSSWQSTNGCIPRDRDNDYTPEVISARRQFIEQRTDASLRRVSSYSLDPAILPGNVENFVGVAQVRSAWSVHCSSMAKCPG
jgi:hydroxymethylglutaryl-CoA reductase (NADPH)